MHQDKVRNAFTWVSVKTVDKTTASQLNKKLKSLTFFYDASKRNLLPVLGQGWNEKENDDCDFSFFFFFIRP